jgi:hypothetical protein
VRPKGEGAFQRGTLNADKNADQKGAVCSDVFPSRAQVATRPNNENKEVVQGMVKRSVDL